MVDNRLRIGVSSCLTGQKVRYDGETKAHEFITGTLAEIFDLVPVCPEVGIGLGVPRPPVALRSMSGTVAAVGVDNPDLDVTLALRDFAYTAARELPAIAGYLFKSRSPSCGLGSADVSLDSGEVISGGYGIYARAILRAMPLLPVAEETCLDDVECRHHFFEQVFIYQHWLQFNQRSWSKETLQEFHCCHEYSIRARSDEAWKGLNAILRLSGNHTLAGVKQCYITTLMNELKRPVSRYGHVRMLKLATSALLHDIPGSELNALFASIDDYARGKTGRSVPASIIRKLLASRPDNILRKQVYLYPSDLEAGLRIWL